MTRLRAIETGRWVVVASTNGRTGVISPDGDVVASADPRTRAVLVEEVGLSTAITPGVRLGPWTGRGCFVLTCVGLLLGAVPYRRGDRLRALGGRGGATVPVAPPEPSAPHEHVSEDHG
jgi:apolipoprotein N-acyltransferase